MVGKGVDQDWKCTGENFDIIDSFPFFLWWIFLLHLSTPASDFTPYTLFPVISEAHRKLRGHSWAEKLQCTSLWFLSFLFCFLDLLLLLYVRAHVCVCLLWVAGFWKGQTRPLSPLKLVIDCEMRVLGAKPSHWVYSIAPISFFKKWFLRVSIAY